MAESIKILTDSQIKTLRARIAEAFSEDLQGQLVLDINNFQKQINQVISAMKLEETFHSKDNRHKGWKIASLTTRRQALAARGYLLIFKFREYLFREKINYRYYYEDNEGNSHVTEFEEDDVLKYIKFTESGIKLNASELRLRGVKEEWDSIINTYFKKYMGIDYVQPAKGGYGYVVRSSIMDIYGPPKGANQGLMSKMGRYQLFNKGHIYEAIDTSISHILFKDGTDINDEAMQNYVFGRYLARDRIIASQGGDNPLTNTSVKSGGADLYDFYTIKIQLEAIRDLLNSSPVNLAEMKESIASLFLNKTKFEGKNSEQLMEQAAQKALDRLLKDLLSE